MSENPYIIRVSLYGPFADAYIAEIFDENGKLFHSIMRTWQWNAIRLAKKVAKKANKNYELVILPV